MDPVNLLIREEPLVWVKEAQVKNEKSRVIDFYHYPFMIDIYADKSKTIVLKKSAQVGITTWALLRAFHAARYHKYNIIYTVPRASDVNQIVTSKVNPMIRSNPTLSLRQANDKHTDNMSQKKLGEGFIFFKGTISEVEGIMITSDRNVYDEYDRSDFETIQTYHSRLEGETSKGEEWFISTPTLPDFGIDVKFEESDQKHWRFKCSRCNYEQHLEWIKNTDKSRRYYFCQKCGRELRRSDIINGYWKARFPKREISGYWINQMMLPWVKPMDLWEYYTKAEQGVDGYSLEYFYNFKLGMPYADATKRIHESLFYKNITEEDVIQIDGYMGVDVQEHELYVVIGTNRVVYGIITLKDDEESSKWTKLENIIKVFQPKTTVIDAGYKPQDVLHFAEKYPYKIYMNWYREGDKDAQMIRRKKNASFAKGSEFQEEIKVETSRNQVIDVLIQKLESGNIKFKFHPQNDRFQELIKHASTMYARQVETKGGKFKREWANTGQNDYLHALVYWLVASQI